MTEQKEALYAIPVEQIAEWVCEAGQRTVDLVADLTEDQLIGPQLPIVNPLLWEIGHIAWFQEKWVLQHCDRQPPIFAQAAALYDSTRVPHRTRWSLPLPDLQQTLRYVAEVRRRIVAWLQRERSPEETYFALLCVFHEDMHTEAFTNTRQILSYPAPRRGGNPSHGASAGPLLGDVEVPGGTFWLGASPDEPFVFDNEKWAHPVGVAPFAIARAPVTQAEFAEFVEERGYRRREFWSPAGWQWRQTSEAEHPVYWRREAPGGWLRRDFDRWAPLEPHRPMVHVNWYEAEAYCRWAGRRLPTEVEWEVAAAAEPTETLEGLADRKRRFPWGDEPPTPRHAHLDWQGLGCLDVAALPEGDSALGCRQMIGNVWEWTASDFLPYPGFSADPYEEYSAPWFGTHKVLRGGCWATRGRMLRNTWRNFYLPERRDIFAGFRTCALRR
jgi:iron(II)-dependent oxidoreductase